jgi:hypothetical protein
MISNNHSNTSNSKRMLNDKRILFSKRKIMRPIQKSVQKITKTIV